jgi:putative molybdopterin biosynthesis protein
MAILAACTHGSISAAARRLSLSYRHVWGELKRWELELGQTLVLWAKGQPAALSPFGEKLLWAERRAQAPGTTDRGDARLLQRAFAIASTTRRA